METSCTCCHKKIDREPHMLPNEGGLVIYPWQRPNTDLIIWVCPECAGMRPGMDNCIEIWDNGVNSAEAKRRVVRVGRKNSERRPLCKGLTVTRVLYKLVGDDHVVLIPSVITQIGRACHDIATRPAAAILDDSSFTETATV